VSKRYPTLMNAFRAGLKSMISVPLISKEQVIGGLHLRSLKANAYAGDDLRLAEKVAHQIAGAIVNAQLFMERKQAEKQLSESKQILERVTQAIPEGILLISNHFKILWANKAALEQSGSTMEEIIGNYCHKLMHHLESPCDSPLDRCPIKEFAKTGKPVIFPHTHFDKEGNKFFVEVSVSPVLNEKGEIVQFVHTCRDVTERTRMESQLAQAQKLQSVGQLAAGIAHEINTPTQYVGDNTRFLEGAFHEVFGLVEKYRALVKTAKEGPVSKELIADAEKAEEDTDLDYLSEEIPKAIRQSLEGIDRVAKIVRAMKEFSHPGTKEKVAVDINKAIETTITIARNEWKYVAEIVMEFDPFLPLVPCLPDEFNQVLLNIIINAAHAIGDVVGDGSKGKGTITVKTCHKGDGVEVRISDTGAGIPGKIRNRIFDPFFTTKEVGKGTGQGLTIAHSVIVNKHGGSLNFETEVGKGTTFIVRLPAEQRANPEGNRR